MSDKVVKYKKPINLNIGIIIFVFIIIYVVFNVFSYMTRVTIAEYQVSQGTIASNNIYQGLIFRDEEVLKDNGAEFVVHSPEEAWEVLNKN